MGTTTKTRSKDDALALLAERRATLIGQAREIAREIARRGGTVHSQQVRAEMARRGLLAGYVGRDNWLGAVFAGKEWVKTGAQVQVQSETIHRRPNPVWRLRTSPPGVPEPGIAAAPVQPVVHLVPNAPRPPAAGQDCPTCGHTATRQSVAALAAKQRRGGAPKQLGLFGG